MSTIQWGSFNSGDWSVAANWYGGVAPTSADAVDIHGQGGPKYTINISTAASALSLIVENTSAILDDTDSLTIGAPLIVSAGDFTLDTSGALSWASGNHWITVYGGGEFQALGTHTLDALTLNLGVGDSTSAKVAFGTLTLGTKALVDFTGSSSAAAPSAQSMTGATLTNQGGWNLTGYATVLVDATTFVNSGQIYNQSAAHVTLEAQTFTNSGKITADGAGGMTISASTSATNTSIIDDEISLTIDTPLFSGSSGVNVSGTASQLIIQSSATGSGSWSAAGILIGGSDEVLEFIGNETFAALGITVQGANASLEIAGSSMAAGELTLTAGTTLAITATGMKITGASGTLVNDGQITDSAVGGSVTFSVADLINNGGISVGAQDIFDVKSALGGTGFFSIGSAAILEFEGSAAAGGTVEFLGNSHGELKLDAAASFDAKIALAGQDDTIDLANIAATSATWANNLLTVTESGGAQLTLNVTGVQAGQKVLVSSDNSGGTLLRLGAAPPPPPQTFVLTTGVDNFTGGAGDNTFVAASGTLSKRDVLLGGTGTNVLQLSGGGVFTLSAPSVLTDIPTVDAQEGVGSSSQTIWLRNGVNVDVDVASGGSGATVVIHGAADSSTIDLGAGNDVVFIGAATETVAGGGGCDVIHVDATTLGAAIDGGSGKSRILVAGGGAMTMGSNIVNIASVVLGAATKAYDFVANSITGLVVDDASAGADIVAAGAAGQVLTGGAGKQTFVGFGSGVTKYLDSATDFNGSHIGDYNVDDSIDISGLAYQKATKVTFKSISSSAGDLSVQTSSGGTTTLHLAGEFGAESFFTKADGHGGTDIFNLARTV